MWEVSADSQKDDASGRVLAQSHFRNIGANGSRGGLTHPGGIARPGSGNSAQRRTTVRPKPSRPADFGPKERLEALHPGLLQSPTGPCAVHAFRWRVDPIDGPAGLAFDFKSEILAVET